MPKFPKISFDAPKKEQAGKTHDPSDLKKIFAHLPEDVQDAVTFCLATGLRFQELRRVRFDWVKRLPNGSPVPASLTMPAEATKSRKARTLGVSGDILALVERRRKDVAPVTPLIFPRATYRKALHRACQLADYKGPNVTMRDLRHIFATSALRNSSDLAAVSRAIGHATVDMTAKYIHTSDPDVLALAVAVSKGVTAVVSQRKRTKLKRRAQA
jgi:integrase